MQNAQVIDTNAVRPKIAPDKRGYKWIAREIEKLDPVTDYEQIWALSTTYYVDDFFMNILYTTGIQNFTQPPAGSIVMGLTTRKAVTSPQKRADDTLSRFWQWFEFGPSHPDVQRSLEFVNQIHMALAKKSPGTFPSRDFIYTCCWIGADMHRLRTGLGVPGYTDKQKVAAHRYWQALCSQFRSEDGQVLAFPDSFEGMLTMLETYEAEPWEKVESGRLLSEAITQQFADAWCPPGLRWVGRQMILSLQKDHIRALMRMGDPNPVMRVIVRRLFWLIITLKERVLPDPKLSTPEKARARRVRPGQHSEPPKVASCPFRPNAESAPAKHP
jgi:hypothetical protein